MGERRRLWRLLLAAVAAAQLTAVAEATTVTVAETGSGPGQVFKPYGITVDASGNAVVAEAGNARGQKFSPAGASLLTFGGFGSGAGQLGDGSADGMQVAVGPQGDYLLVTSQSGMVHRYRPDGAFVEQWPHGAAAAVGIAALANGDVYVLTSASEVVRFTANGAFVARWPVTGSSQSPLDIAGAGDRLYVLAFEGLDTRFVAGYDGAGTEVVRWRGEPYTSERRGSLQGASGIGIGAGGSVLTAGGYGIEMFSPSGEKQPGPGYPTRMWWKEPSESCGVYLSAPPPSVVQNSPLDVAGDADGNIWLTAQGNRVYRIDLAPTVMLDYGPYAWGMPAVGTPMTFDASASTVPFGSITRYEWDFDGDGVFEVDTGATPTARHVYGTPGTHRATVRVTGPTGLTATRSQSVRFVEWMPSLGGTTAITHRDKRIRGPHPLGAPCSPIERYEWDLDGDGVFERDTGAASEVVTRFTDPGKVLIALRTTRAGGHTDIGRGYVVVYLSPPPGPVGVSINDGDIYTNSRDVDLHLVWRRWTGDAQVANDGGFKHAKKIALWEKVPWRLEDAGSTRLPRVVYVRFGPTIRGAPAATYQDDIILDQTRPVVTGFETVEPPAAAAAARRHRLAIRARDSVSGVDRMQLTTKRSKPGRWRKFRRRASLRTNALRAFVRVRDRAGNRSRWRRVRL